ncbi:coproporphyrinogen-III oxidase [Leptospira kobayashii]|uniref:Coproporphyrinogen-III oxidase n=1 Tax=Leptospira kobayashii TaxID=1917830 RepID=A0ABM7UHV1_9LEPT|nr:oxygen-independent coproporphyrinogen III oxidase [Leptospira kobayashii]BDA78191.1 coproporphyrinogen-III oxidase [Leptospira kobayashii]
MLARKDLLRKYDIPAPRYTSYPTVPYWTDMPSSEEWIDSLENSLAKQDSSLAIYVHIPFCETLCTFCGCNTSITKNHTVEEPYVESVIKELDLYISKISNLKNRSLDELHLGGGTPTYLSEKNLEYLISNITGKLSPNKNAEFSIEVDPRRTRRTQLEILYKYGFRRISLGVQDFDAEVQRLVNRIQPFENTENITETARELGYTSVNFDLIYGLPKQTIASMEKTIELTLSLRPDRIAFYSYAHVPWIKSSQRLFTEEDLPKSEEKRELYERGRKLLEAGGYQEIGMDHFALKTDSLWKASEEGKLHRNFMGYSSHKTDVLLGLGTSSISETSDSFHQNEKLEIKYRRIVNQGIIPSFRGHKLNDSDKTRRQLILKLMTTWEVKIPSDWKENLKNYLQEMESDHLIEWDEDRIKITEDGRPFLRIVCTALDEKLRNSQPNFPIFSKAI